MRLFIGLQPSHEFREALAELQEKLKAAGVKGRYLIPSNLHLTLAFIGEWPENIAEILPIIENPFEITLSHMGLFTNAKVLWAGVKPSAELEALAERVRDVLDERTIPYDHQVFNPHITLVRKPVLPEDDVSFSVEVPRASMAVREVCLYQSVHEADGMRYTVIGRSEKA